MKTLDEIKRLKAFRLSRVEKVEGKEWGLLDSGATHPLRVAKKGEQLERLPLVKVALAGGTEVEMHLSEGGSIVSREDVEPIVPMGLAANVLRCKIEWEDGVLRLKHPAKGTLHVKLEDGCPLLPRKLAMELIEEIEEKCRGRGAQRRMKAEEEDAKMAFINKLVNEHPAFRGVPEKVKEALKAKPDADLKSLANRRRRKLWRKQGVVAHVFSGEKEGYTLSRALKEVGADQRRLLEVDILHGKEKGDLGRGGRLYPQLLHMALEGQLEGVIGGPPCRSVLRHYEVEGLENLPRPVRRWEGEEFGLHSLSPEEEKLVAEDDILLFRMWMIYVIAEEVRKASTKEKPVLFGMEHPAPPTHVPDNVSIWRTEQWMRFKRVYSFGGDQLRSK